MEPCLKHAIRPRLLLVSCLLLAMAGFTSTAALARSDGEHGSQAVIESTEQGEFGGIGLSRTDWEAIYGQGRSLQGLVEYPNVIADGYIVLVGFEADRVAHIEFGYKEAEAGGLLEVPTDRQVQDALPADAEFVDGFTVPPPVREGTMLRVGLFRSESLAEVTDGQGTILVVSQVKEKIIEPGSPVQNVVVRVTLTIPTAGIPETSATGNPGGIGLARADWEAVYGEAMGTQSGEVYENATFPVPGEAVLARYGMESDRITFLRFTYEGNQFGGGAPQDVDTQVVDALPDDAELRERFYLPATPEGPIALRAEWWQSDYLADLTGDSGSVMVIYEEVAIQQNSGSAPVTVIPEG